MSALPPQALSPLVPPSWRQWWPDADALGWFSAVPYVSVYLWLDRKISRRQSWTRPQTPDSLNCDFYDYANIYPGWEHRNSLIGSNIVGAERVAGMTDEEIVAGTLAELADNLLLGERAHLVHAVVNRIPMAVVAPRPGFEAHRLPARTPVPGLVLAGDWTQTRLPSSMESAAASGFTAAERILAEEHRPCAVRRELPSAGLLAQAMGSIPHARPRRKATG